MKLKVMIAVAIMAALPLCAQAQQPKPSQMQQPKAPKITNADAQRVVKIISADKAIKYETVVKVMDTLQRGGVQRIGLSVQLASP